MNENLKGKKILLTGASRGVGRASAVRLLSLGAEVFGISRDPERLSRAAEDLAKVGPGKFSCLALDLAGEGAPETLAQEVDKLWGSLDIAILNAGVMLHHDGGILGEPLGTLEASLELNLLSPFRLARALLPALKRGIEPRILNVGSGAGTLDAMMEANIASYRLSKWALNGLTLLEASELKGVISVNAFDPGWVRTDLGGPQAPGTAEEAAEGLLKTLALPFEISGQFFKDGKVIPW